jgi:hypothetical protein
VPGGSPKDRQANLLDFRQPTLLKQGHRGDIGFLDIHIRAKTTLHGESSRGWGDKIAERVGVEGNPHGRLYILMTANTF